MANAKPDDRRRALGAFNTSYETYNYGRAFGGERAAHSIWFGVLGDLGYPGLILFVANSSWRSGPAGGSIAWRANRRNCRDLRIYANALISALVVFCVAGSFLSRQYNEFAWHLIGLSTALRLIVLHGSERNRPLVRCVPARESAA